MSRYHPAPQVRNHSDGLSLAHDAVMAAIMDGRKALKNTPFVFNGVTVLGWAALTHEERDDFFAGKGKVKVLDPAALTVTRVL